ncbi:hypothetical protein ARMGADRAFT_1144086 [Armillaria gallica]|uniref:Uncharacterized protein n=1 Tax=Armillaria gallica TaxID=47427 RepID=A0A2H3CJV5_ARMGA|nr:hypothetical protein ARMGADRAFT_1144086 [Armillaria gallica]
MPHSGPLPESGNSSVMFQPVNVVDTTLPSPDTTTVFENKHFSYDITRLTVSFARSETPQPWTSYIHFEGACYFHCEHDLFTVYTDAYLFDLQELQAVQQFVDQVDKYLTRHDITEVSFDTEKVDLVLDVTLSGTKRTICGYYHANQTVFWLDEFESLEHLWPKINGVTLPDHIHQQIEPNVHHWALFPSPQCVSQAVIDELRDIVLHAIGGLPDSMVSLTSTVSYSIEELHGMLQLLPVKSGEANNDFGPRVSRFAYILMKHFGAHFLFCYFPRHRLKPFCRLAHQHFLHFYSEPFTCLSRGTSVYNKNKVHKRSFLFHILKYLLFAAPCAHL